MTTYKINLEPSYNNQAAYEQLAYGDYGLGWEKNAAWATAVSQQNSEFFVSHAVHSNCKRTKDGRFYKKNDALKALHNLEIFNARGQGVRIARGQPAYGLAAKIIEA